MNKRLLAAFGNKLSRKNAVIAVILIIIIIAAYIILNRKAEVVEDTPIVSIMPTQQENVEIYGDYVGRIRAQQFVEVRARVEGFLEQMLFEEGTHVNKDQVLFIINQDQYIAKVDKAKAQLKKDEAQARKAERDLEGYTMVTSPISGNISERYVDLGTLVGTSGKSLLATVVKSDTVLVDFSMTALDYLKSKERNITIGQKDSTRTWQPTVTITLPDNTTYPYKGIVDFAEPQVDPRTGTFSVRAEMPNPKQVLLPGQFTKVRLLLDVRSNATVVPQKALIIEKGGAYIYVMRKDSTVEKRFIELGPEFGNSTVVERGLVPGENIVVEGYHKLTPGIKVKVSNKK